MNNATLSIGAYGSNVSSLQKALSNQGFLSPASEISQAFFGPGTRQAVMAFQASKKLPKTGQVDAQTASLLAAGEKPETIKPTSQRTARVPVAVSDSLIAYSVHGSEKLAEATLDGSGHLVWAPASPDWTQCNAFGLEGSVRTIWLVVDDASVTLDQNQFPTFNITTPFCFLQRFALTYEDGSWSFSGIVQTNGVPLSLPIDSDDPLPSKDITLKSATFANSPPQMDVTIPPGGGTMTVTIRFVEPEPGDTFNRSTLALSYDGANLDQFWSNFPTDSIYKLTFGFLIGIAADGTALSPMPYLEIRGFSESLTKSWNQNIAQPYQVSVPTAEPDAPITGLWSFLDNVDAWIYRAFVVLTLGDSPNVTWQTGNFTAEGSFCVCFPNLLVHSGSPFQAKVLLTAAIPDLSITDALGDLSGKRPASFGSQVAIFAFRAAMLEPVASQSLRLGALDLSFSSTALQLDSLPWHVLGYVEPNQIGALALNRTRIQVQSLLLPVSQVQVGSEDPLPDDTGGDPILETEPPLVIPLSNGVPPPDPTKQPYTLQLDESNPLGNPRTLTLTLMQEDGSGSTLAPSGVSLLILDRNPFLVARVTLPSLLGSATAANNLVAEWSNTYPYGEGWHMQSGAQPFTVYLPSQGIGEQLERETNDIPPGNAPIDFRFSPAAQLQIAPPVLQGATYTYFEAPWNLRRLLATPGQNVPGSLLPSFSAEFLYGLSVSVSSPGLWVAELAALTGRLASPLPSGSLGKDDWDQAILAFQARPAALTPWDGTEPDSLLLSDEAQFSLRPSADLAAPQPEPAGTAPYPDSENGLKGGVAWIFESENQYRSIWQQPNSTSALLADPVFSALGGWARQRAVFLNGLSTINSQVEMGRVSTISVEQLGRIGVLWNRAKLVTVYKRTVQASDQFAGKQDPLLGRPIVRKVEEYVELLEPIRSYPESGSGAIDVAFVQGSEFKSKVIAVDSSWGSDLPSGMQVPLWNPAANPSVYPKPHIILQVAVDPNTGLSTQSQEIDEPEKLVFYSDTTRGAGANPDLWPAVQGIDYADVDTTVATNQGYRLSTDPGLGSFTWGLLPAAFPTNVVAQRTSSSISANLKNVSMMRFKAANVGGQPPTLLQVNQVLDGATSIFQEISDHWSDAGVQNVVNDRALGSYFSDLSTYVTNFAPNGSIPGGDLRKAGQAIANAGAEFLQQAALDAVGLVSQAQEAISNAVASSIASVAQAQGQVLNTMFGGLNVDMLRTGLTQAPIRLANITTKLQSVQGTIQASFGQAGQTLLQLNGLQQTVAQNVQSFTSDLAGFESLLGDGFLPGWPQLATIEARIAQPIVALQSGAVITDVQTQQMVMNALASLNQDVTTLTASLGSIPATFSHLLPATIDPGTPKLSSVTTLQQAQQWLASIPPAQALTQQLQVIGSGLTTWLNTNISSWLPASAGIMQQTLSDASAGLQDVLLARSILAGAGNFGTTELSQLQDQFQTTISTFLSTATSALGNNITSQVYNQASQVLSTVRAFGAAPIAPGLTFNLPQVPAPSLDQLAYFFDSTLTNVPITSGVQSVLASTAQALPQLMPIQLNVPIDSLLDRLVPDPATLAQTAISDIFNHLAGMDLSFLFSGLFPPLNAPDGIQITHSINPQTLAVAVEADIDVSFANDVTVLNEGPILLQLLNARFQATIKIQETPGSQPVEEVNGQISGDWELQIANLSLVTFASTSLTFDQTGHIRFNVSPEKVRLASVMQFIADLVNSLGSPGSGLSIVFSPNPIAVASTLDLPLPDIAGGVFALSNIRLGALFSIGMDDQNNFQFVVGMNLSEEDAPFAIVIFILGGGGWIQAQMCYTAKAGASPQVSITIGISAIASLEIALGPISGGVSISFSLFAEYNSGSSLDLGIVIVVAGHVSLLGIVDADITLLLEADYAAGQLTGRGSVSVDIKICWCFTLSIHQEVEYSFGNQQSSNHLGGQEARLAPLAAALTEPDDFWNNASNYIDMLTA